MRIHDSRHQSLLIYSEAVVVDTVRVFFATPTQELIDPVCVLEARENLKVPV